jgi:hypothetical protein
MTEAMLVNFIELRNGVQPGGSSVISLALLFDPQNEAKDASPRYKYRFVQGYTILSQKISTFSNCVLQCFSPPLFSKILARGYG